MSNLLGSKTWTLPIGDSNGTVTIALSFIFLAYILHPAIEAAYHRLRAYRAWRAIQKRKTVNVTNYPLLAEIFGGRGLWDGARIITVLLLAFSLASWGLELSMGLASLEGEADLLNRPPPVFLNSDLETAYVSENNDFPWQVLTNIEINDNYDGDWRNLGDLNIGETKANSRYYVVKDTNSYLGADKKGTRINGRILVADWSTAANDRPKLHYDTNSTVESLTCSGETLQDAAVFHGDVEWGSAFDCEAGPATSNAGSAPPAIILTNSDTGEVHIIVEESSSYPTFLYSVWTAPSADSNQIEYSFHIASNIRLVEAVVTGIVHGEADGAECFWLLRAFSETLEPYEQGRDRASPFGERPTGDTVQVQDLENLEAGVEINMDALLCLIWVMALTAFIIAWSICLRASIGLDVYDRDELFRAVSLQGEAASDPTADHPAIHIFVRREDTGCIKVFINDTIGEEEVGWKRFFRRAPRIGADGAPDANVDEDAEAAQADDKFGGAVVPEEGTVSLGGTLTTEMTPARGRKSVNVFASPVPKTPARSGRVRDAQNVLNCNSPDSTSHEEVKAGN